MRSVTRSPPPPIISSGCGDCSGLGIERRVGELVVAALEVAAALRSTASASPRTPRPAAPAAPSSCRRGCRRPRARSAASRRPCPSSSRPPEMMSTCAAILATTAGWRYVLPSTIVPTRMRGTSAASALSVLHDSSMAPSRSLVFGQEVVGHAGDVPSGRLEVPPELQHSRPGLHAHAREQAKTHRSSLLVSGDRCRRSWRRRRCCPRRRSAPLADRDRGAGSARPCRPRPVRP